MKISCEIIKDLLPLYHDGVCSNESKAMIEEHLAECDNCKAELDTMDEVLTVTSMGQNLSEAEEVKKLSRKWKKGMLKSLLKGALLTLLIVTSALLILFCFADIRIV
ncbi:zf-HC2 domain-containing protein [Sinanaerobacter sp. ZZT-01]|uniref:zf-HC2 domain-containing protein n=1 Tax=Sinanaerobacter sp. ZZT-01 TaxID=3111540 RepID=UPI002D7A2AC7|nr:zf-HC2 domain-containing protein [Sinanaerobacter sp. ZZT-01]WRR92962.1 zf-HC2 domain-containing protein [Sinanaerobacter sp. ZZT-01]